MAQNTTNWTERSFKDFIYRIAFDFVHQLETAMDATGMNQAALAKHVGVTESRVSQILNNPGNLTLKNMIRFSRAVGHKIAIVTYYDDDPNNENGLVSAEIFTSCWERFGRPIDFFALRETEAELINDEHLDVSSEYFDCGEGVTSPSSQTVSHSWSSVTMTNASVSHG